MCSSNISADQDQTDLRVSTWQLLGSRVCKVAFVWTAMIPLIIYFINAVPILLALLTVATTATYTPEPITSHRSHVRTRANHCRAQTQDNSGFIPTAARAGPGFCRRFGPVVCISTDCCGLVRLNESGLNLFWSEEIRGRTDNKVESESVDVRV